MTMTSDQDTDIFDDPDNFKLSQVVHPPQLSICMASEEDTKAVAELKLCPNFEYEDDYDEHQYDEDDDRCGCSDPGCPCEGRKIGSL